MRQPSNVDGDGRTLMARRRPLSPQFVGCVLRKLPAAKKRLLLRAAIRARLLPHRRSRAPVFLQVEPTTRCNLSCTHCPRVLRDVPAMDMEFDLFKHLVNSNRSICLLHLQGWGEPLLHHRFFDMVAYAAQHGILVGSCTNGHVMTPELLAALSASPLSYLAVSVDGTDTLLRECREGSDYAVLARNLAAVTKAKNRGTLLAFWVVVRERNLPNMEQIIDTAGAAGVGHILFSFEHAGFGVTDAGSSLLLTRSQAELHRLRNELARRCRSHGIMSSFTTQRPPPSRLKHCRWPWYAASIRADGQVTPCCLLREEPLLGSVKAKNLQTVWKDPEYAAFRKELAGPRPPAFCRTCQYL